MTFIKGLGRSTCSKGILLFLSLLISSVSALADSAAEREAYFNAINFPILVKTETVTRDFLKLIESSDYENERRQAYTALFMGELSRMTADLYTRLEKLLDNETVNEDGFDITQRIKIADLVLETELANHFDAEKILKKIETDFENPREIDTEHLRGTTEKVTVPYTDAQNVPAQVKDNQTKKSPRCEECNRPHLIECRCKKKLCVYHRYPHKHGCTYDYKKQQKEELEKKNPVVKADRLPDRI